MKPLTLLHTIAFLGIFYKIKKECLSLRPHILLWPCIND